MARVLLIETDQELEVLLGGVLQTAGHTVRPVRPDGDVARALQTTPPHVVLIGPSLADVAGEALCQEVRRASGKPIARLVASGEPGSGCADAYVAVPSHPRALLSRVGALVRNGGTA